MMSDVFISGGGNNSDSNPVYGLVGLQMMDMINNFMKEKEEKVENQ